MIRTFYYCFNPVELWLYETVLFIEGLLHSEVT